MKRARETKWAVPTCLAFTAVLLSLTACTHIEPGLEARVVPMPQSTGVDLLVDSVEFLACPLSAALSTTSRQSVGSMSLTVAVARAHHGGVVNRSSSFDWGRERQTVMAELLGGSYCDIRVTTSALRHGREVFAFGEPRSVVVRLRDRGGVFAPITPALGEQLVVELHLAEVDLTAATEVQQAERMLRAISATAMN